MVIERNALTLCCGGWICGYSCHVSGEMVSWIVLPL